MLVGYARPPAPRRPVAAYKDLSPDLRAYADLEPHARLLATLGSSYEGWAYACPMDCLQDILPLCPPGVRIAAWLRPHILWNGRGPKPCSWEPVIWSTKRDEPLWSDKYQANLRDSSGWTDTGCEAHPRQYYWWIFDLLKCDTGDQFYDLFDVGAVEWWQSWMRVHHGLWVAKEDSDVRAGKVELAAPGAKPKRNRKAAGRGGG